MFKVTDTRGSLVNFGKKRYISGGYYADKRRRRKMNLIILLCMPLIPAIIVTICAVLDNRKRTKHDEPETA
jgi:hypothetical protein